MRKSNLQKALVLLAVTFGILPALGNASDIQLIKERLIRDALVNEGFTGRTSSFSDASELHAADYLANLQADGKWPDIDYLDQDNDWSPIDHVGRVLALTLAYAKPESPLYHDPDLLAKITQSIDYWYQAKPTCKNWYKNDIGKQFFLQQIGLLLGDRLPENLLSKIIADLTEKPSMGGVNMTWLAVSTIYRGVLENNEARLQLGADAFSRQVAINERYEGLKPDYSFQQHGRHLYNGLYGTSFLSDTVRIASALRGTQYALSSKQVQLLRNYYLESMRWSLRGPLQDYNVRGRQVGRTDGQDLQAYELLKPLDYLTQLDPEFKDAYQGSKQAIRDGLPQDIEGNRHFWWADFTVHHRPGYMASLKMCSKRTLGVEIDVNRENLLGYWLPFGFTYLYQNGREYEDIFPAWDWGRLPGVTSPHEEFAIKKGRYTQQTAFVGAASDGRYGVSSMDLDTQKTQAKKSWFFFDDEWVALGAGIRSTHSAPIVTGVNQTLLRGEVIVDKQAFAPGQSQLEDPGWVWHDRVGYLFPDSQDVALKAESQSGRFQRIYALAPDITVEKDIFSLWFEHGSQPKGASYAYTVVPGVTPDELDERSKNPSIQILSNTEQLQAVAQTSLKLTGAVFHTPGTLTLLDGLTIAVSVPSILLIDQAANKLHFSDPTQSLSQITLNIENPDHSKLTRTLDFPKGKQSGTTLTVPLHQPLLFPLFRKASDAGIGHSPNHAVGFGHDE